MTRSFRPLTLVLTLFLSSAPFQTLADQTLTDKVFTGQAPAEQFQMPDLRAHPAGPERKVAFFNLLIPLIEQENARINADREWLMAMRDHGVWNNGSRQRLASICKEYGIHCDSENDVSWNRLLARVDVLPMQLVLIQAVEESGWGTSRFAREGNNLFGIRCFGEDCGIGQLGSSRRYQSFASVQEALQAYVNNINSHSAYQKLRERRAALRAKGQVVTALALIPALGKYSVRGDAYLSALQSLLDTNAPLIERLRDQDDDAV
ncbi:protein bax [Phytohalomonas tamaricis]|uniref:protein bax n=1 Tax=Phytohalomonas tamaricis TaxID=2081032 RepID=UPI000D0AED0B|nr:protein bax [Phytohalomonas tamaricis]